MTELITVGALDARPVLGLGALAGLVTLFIAVAAAKDTRLWAVTGDVTLALAVVANATASTTGALGGFRAV